MIPPAASSVQPSSSVSAEAGKYSPMQRQEKNGGFFRIAALTISK